MEKVVKGATKIKLAAPKSKYVESIMAATHGGEAGVADVFRTLQHRLRDSTWTIAFKSLIVIHLMIREGEPDATLRFIAENPRQLAISNFTEVQVQGGNIRSYDNYLLERAKAFRDTKVDHVRAGIGRLKRLSVDKGLLRETESVQQQIRACLRCDLLSTESDNEITLTAFRLLTMDLLVLFSVMNEGTINVLEHYFEMSRPDAERALAIYKTFSKQTDQVVQFLSVARQYELSTRLEIPKLKHAPTSLTNSLEEYLNDPDFEINRRQYLAQQQAKSSGGGKVSTAAATTPSKNIAPSSSFPPAKPASETRSAPAKGPAPDLIDFFESIEQNQQPMAQQPTAQAAPVFNGYQQPQQQPQPQQFFQQQTGFGQQQNAFMPQQTGFPQQQQPVFQDSNPFGQPQAFAQNPVQFQAPQQTPAFTGAGFGGYTPQSQSHGFHTLSPIPQDSVASFQQQSPATLSPQQSSNPFRQSMVIPNQQTGGSQFSVPSSPLTRQSTNPFAKHSVAQQPTGQSFASNSPFTSPQPDASAGFAQQPNPVQPAPMLQPQRTGTNPFARVQSPPQQNMNGQPAASHLRPNPTGSTNPFRQSAFVNQQTGQAWQQVGDQGTLSGLNIDQLQTTPIFPRPGQTT